MAIKLKPVRGEISATNPIPDQGASILNAVIQSDPNIQSTVNTLGALTEREKTHRQNLEKVRIANKVKLNEQLLRKDLLATEEAVTKGDIQGNLLSPEQIDANKAALHQDFQKKYMSYRKDMGHEAALDKALYDPKHGVLTALTTKDAQGKSVYYTTLASKLNEGKEDRLYCYQV